MIVTQEQVFETKKKLQAEIQEQEAKLRELIDRQHKATKVEELAATILEYEQLQYEISSRAHVFALLSSPLESLTSPFVKSQLFSYIEAAETVGPELVDFIVNALLQQVRADVQAGEDDIPDLIEAEYKEYIIPGKVIAERFEEIDPLLNEMIRFCRAVDPKYDENRAATVLEYGIEKSVKADTRMPPTIKAVKEVEFRFLTPEGRGRLLNKVTEQLAIDDFEKVRKQNIAMEKAIEMLARKEEESEAK